MRILFFMAALFISSANAVPQQFLVFGDMPYTPIDEALLSAPNGRLYQAVQQTPHLFVAHVGDLKSGSLPCTDDLLQKNYSLLSHLTSSPLVYTPGDNDWTDCDRAALEPRFDELERLAYIRTHFAQSELTLPDYHRQKEQVENQAWRIDDVQYLTLHVVGTNNGRAQVLKSEPQAALAAAQKRDNNNMQWLASQLEAQVSAAVIFMQADIYEANNYGEPCTQELQQNCDALAPYRQHLDALAEQVAFPILLVHGDTSAFCFSQRESGLWHLNAPGDFRVLDIAKVRVQDSQKEPFEVSTVTQPLAKPGVIPQCTK
ncbi:hypothetical protein [Pseudoalteromonas sp. BDTF-M6]|uniref:hypothetical protein n=1 Tax=Pseudoalteromonas sp. BDTF-M6 TaxID=2796132 RepID=UPI0020161CC8|nr:hypothetical protein [Pseudoalteromonas sp. BDTF-M6]